MLSLGEDAARIIRVGNKQRVVGQRGDGEWDLCGGAGPRRGTDVSGDLLSFCCQTDRGDNGGARFPPREMAAKS